MFTADDDHLVIIIMRRRRRDRRDMRNEMLRTVHSGLRASSHPRQHGLRRPRIRPALHGCLQQLRRTGPRSEVARMPLYVDVRRAFRDSRADRQLPVVFFAMVLMGSDKSGPGDLARGERPVADIALERTLERLRRDLPHGKRKDNMLPRAAHSLFGFPDSSFIAWPRSDASPSM